MFEEYEKRKRKQVTLMKSLLDYGMGVIFALVGIFFLFGSKLNINIGNNVDTGFQKAFGGICLLYAIWRFYRGYKKNYFR